VEIYKGDFLAESPYVDSATDEREAQKERLTRCLHLLVESLLRARRWTEMIPLCRRGLEADPYHEGFHSHLVEANLALGNRLEALGCYRHYEEVLSRDLGLLPSPRMRGIADKIVASGPRDR
jgi:SARP family transcriptional regulator, regulator of embCAB operon